MNGIKDKAKAWALPTAIFLVVMLIVFSIGTNPFGWGEDELESHSARQRVSYGETYEVELPGNETFSHQLLTEYYAGRKYKEDCDGLRCNLPLNLTTSHVKQLSELGLQKKFLTDHGEEDTSGCIMASGFEFAKEVPVFATNTTYSCINTTEQVDNATFKGNATTTTCTPSSEIIQTGTEIKWFPISEATESKTGFVVNLWADMKPNCYLDAVPTVFGEDLPYAWFNSSMAYKRAIIGNMTTGGEDVVFLINSTGKLFNQTCWFNATLSTTDTTVGYVYYNDADDYDVVNSAETERLPFFCEMGGVNLNNSADTLYASTNGTLAFYFMENSGSTARDIINGTIATATTAVWDSNGTFGQAINIGNNVANAFSFTYTSVLPGGFTVNMWVKRNGHADADYALDIGGECYSIFYSNDAPYNLSANYQDASSGTAVARYDYGDDNGWHMISTTFDQATKNFTMYFDGHSVSSDYVTNSGKACGTANWIGKRGDNNNPHNGAIEMLEFYNATKSDAWVLAKYEQGNSRLGIQEVPPSNNYSWGAANVSVVPLFPLTHESLNVSWDNDNSTTHGNYTIVANWTRWYSNGNLNTTFDNYSKIPSHFTVRGQTWQANISLSNGTVWSNFTNSNLVTIQNSQPSTPTQNSPADGINTPNLTQTLNCSGSTDPDNDTLTYVFHNDSGYAANSTAGVVDLIWAANGTFNWSCRSDDQNGNYSAFTANRTITFNTAVVLSFAEGHTDNVAAGTNQMFYFNVSVNNLTVRDVDATLRYNNTAITVNKYAFNNTHYRFNASVYVPFGNSSHSFDWNITLDKTYPAENQSTIYNYSQSVQQLDIGLCSGTTNIVVANFTMQDEVNNTGIDNGTFKGTFVIWKDVYANRQTFTVDIAEANISTYLCLSPNNTLYRSDALIEYVADGFDKRRHYYINTTLNSSNLTLKSTNLSLLLISLGTGVEFTVVDEAETPYVGAYIQVERYDPGTDSFKVVSMMQTDTNGQDYGYFRMYDVLYRIKVVIDGVVAFTGEKAVFIETSQIITITAAGWAATLDSLDEPQVTITFNNASNTFTTTWSTPDGTSKKVCMSIWRNNLTFSGYAGDSCLTAASGTLTHNIGTEVGSVWTAQAYADDPYKVYATARADRLRGTLVNNQTALAIGLLILLTMVFVGIWSEAGTIVMLVIGVLVIIPIGFINITTSAFIAMAIVALLLILRMKR